jgi:O-antigen/teichoic acid export membrane protein
MLASLGMCQAIVFHTGQRRYTVSQIWTASTLIALVQSIGVVLVGLVVVPLALHRYSPTVRHLALLFVLCIPFLIIVGVPESLLRGRLDFLSFNVIRAIPAVVYSLGLAVLLLLRRGDLRRVVTAQILAYVLAMAGGWAILLRKEKLRFRFKGDALGSLLGYGWKTQLATVTSYINQRVDQLLLSLFVSPRELGLYVVAVTVSTVLGFFPQASAVVTLAAGSNLSPQGARRVIAGSFRTSLIWLIAGCTALFVVAPRLITLVFGPGFAGSGLACRILLPGSVALGLNQVLYDGARSLGDPALPSYAEGLAAILTCLGLYALLPRLGFLGAAIASTAAYTTSLMFTLVLYRARLGFHLHELLGVSNGPVAERGV